jgi:hypothetical protein
MLHLVVLRHIFLITLFAVLFALVAPSPTPCCSSLSNRRWEDDPHAANRQHEGNSGIMRTGHAGNIQ